MPRPSVVPKVPPISERQFQQQVVQLAEILGYTTVHTRTSINGAKGGWTTATSLKGWVDLILIGAGRVLFRELKSERGTLTPEQKDVLALLRANGQDAGVWRPSDLESGRIQNELRRVRAGSREG